MLHSDRPALRVSPTLLALAALSMASVAATAAAAAERPARCLPVSSTPDPAHLLSPAADLGAGAVLPDVDGAPTPARLLDPCWLGDDISACGGCGQVIGLKLGAPGVERPITLEVVRAALGASGADDRRLAGVAVVAPPGATQQVIEARVYTPNISDGRWERVWLRPSPDGWRPIYAGLIEEHAPRATHSFNPPMGPSVGCEALVDVRRSCRLEPEPFGLAPMGWAPLRETCVEAISGGCVPDPQLAARWPQSFAATNQTTSNTERVLRLVMQGGRYVPSDQLRLDDAGHLARPLPGPCWAARTIGGTREVLRVKWQGTRKVSSQLPMDLGAGPRGRGTVSYRYAAGRLVARRDGDAGADGPAGPTTDPWAGAEQVTYDRRGRLLRDGGATHRYDGAGRRVSTRYASDHDSPLPVVIHRMGDGQPISHGRVDHRYDEAGRRVRSAWHLDDDDRPEKIDTYHYDARGRLVRRVTDRVDERVDHIETRWYDAVGQLVRISVDDHVTSHEFRRYDDAGNLIERQWWEGGVRRGEKPDVSIAYDYGCWAR